jgi:hypothetical protein
LFDFILQDFKEKSIIFIQASTETPQEHKTKETGELKVLKAFKRKNNTCLLERELEMVTGEKDWEVWFKDGRMSATTKMGWSVKFLFITSALESDIKGQDYSISNMAIVGQEQLSSLSVVWQP